MRKIKIGLTACALVLGFVTAFASKASRTNGTFYRTISGNTTVPASQIQTVCPGGTAICANAFTAGGTEIPNAEVFKSE